MIATIIHELDGYDYSRGNSLSALDGRCLEERVFLQHHIYVRHFDYMAPVRGLLLVYRRCVADADSLKFSQIWLDVVRCGN